MSSLRATVPDGGIQDGLATLAVERGCGRFEWAVLDWNAQAIEFYRALGATVLPDWRIVRVVGPALAALAAGPPADATGTAGLAGLLAMRAGGMLRPGEAVAVLITGAER